MLDELGNLQSEGLFCPLYTVMYANFAKML